MSDLELSVGVENVSAEDAPAADEGPGDEPEVSPDAVSDAPVDGRFGENVPGVGGAHYSNESYGVFDLAAADEAAADESAADEAAAEEDA